jgi:leucyl-tRNA synthetase
VKVWLKLLAPFAPYMCEEAWSRTGDDGFISLAPWPQLDKAKVDVKAEEQENFIADVIEDTWNILRATKIAPQHIYFYVAVPWKQTVFRKVLAKTVAGEAKIGEIMKELSSDPTVKPHMKEVAVLVPKLIKALTKLSSERKANLQQIKALNEKEILQGAVGFFKDRFNSEVFVYSEDNKDRYDPKNRAAMAMPHQPAIFVE